MKSGITQQGGKDILFVETPKGTRYLEPSRVVIQADTGRVAIVDGTLRHLSDEDAAMVSHLPLVQQVGNVKVGA